MKYLVVVLLLSLLLNGWFLWDRREAETEKLTVNREWQERLDNYLAGVKTAGHLINELQAKRVRDSLAFKSRENGLKMRVATYEKTLIKQRIPIQPLIDSIQALGDFVETYDSLSTAKDSLISGLNSRIDTLQTSYNREIRQIEHSYANQQQISKLWEGQAKNFESLYHDADRKARKKFSVGPYAGYGVSREGLSPSVGVSVQWKLLSF